MPTQLTIDSAKTIVEMATYAAIAAIVIWDRARNWRTNKRVTDLSLANQQVETYRAQVEIDAAERTRLLDKIDKMEADAKGALDKFEADKKELLATIDDRPKPEAVKAMMEQTATILTVPLQKMNDDFISALNHVVDRMQEDRQQLQSTLNAILLWVKPPPDADAPISEARKTHK